jgi:hypothetical protein
MTADQYRREGAEAMRKAALYQCVRVPAELPGSPRMAFELGLYSCESAIRAIDVDEVLAGLRPRCAECDDGILPCPFCGGPAEITEIDEGENAGGSCVCCTKCLASGNVEFGLKENFVSNWNRRVKTPVSDPVAQLVEAARAMRSAICGPDGFAECVRRDSGLAYPWPALEIAESLMDAALAAMDASHD